MKKVLVAFLCLFGTLVFGQELDWLYSFGDNNHDAPKKILSDDAGDIYVMGVFTGSVDFNPGFSENVLTTGGSRDGYLAKYSRNGSLEWTIQFEPSLLSVDMIDVEIDSEGDLLLLVEHVGELNVIATNGEYNEEVSGRSDVIYKFDANGGYVSRDLLYLDFAVGFDLDDDDNRYFHGSFEGTYEFSPEEPEAELSAINRDGYILKLDDSNNFLWVKQFESTESSTTLKLELGNDNQPLIIVVFRSSVDANPSDEGEVFTTISANPDFFVAKMDEEGDLIWAGQITGWGVEDVYAFDLDEEGNVYVAGGFFHTVDFNPDSDEFLMSSSGTTCFVLKLTNDGEFIWVKGIDPDLGSSFYMSIHIHEELIYLGGVANGAEGFDLNPDPDEEDIFEVAGQNFFVQILDENGNFEKSLHFDVTGYSYPRSLVVNQHRDLFVVGDFSNILSSVDNSVTRESNGGSDIFLTKFSYRFANTPMLPSKNISLFPNPTSGDFYLQTNETISSLQIHTLAGQMLYQASNLSGENFFSPDLPRGTYIVTLETKETSVTQKLVILE